MSLEITDAFHLIDTSESYYHNILLKDNYALIPYLNLTIMPGHPLNDTSGYRLLDYGYLSLSGVSMIKRSNEWIFDDSTFKYGKYEFITVGGVYVLKNHTLETTFLCQEAKLILKDDFRISDSSWHIEQSSSAFNMLNPEDVNSFLAFQKLPDDLQRFYFGNSKEKRIYI